MLMPTGKFVLWFFLIFMYLTNIIVLAQPDFRDHICGEDGNYTRNSTYQRTLGTTLSTLPNTNNGFGFFNFSAGESGSDERVYSVALCEGDLEPDVCRGCINDSIIKLPILCPNQKEAVGHYSRCWLPYSNVTLMGKFEREGVVFLLNTDTASDPDRFNGALGPLMNQLRAAASGGDSLLKYASGNTPGPDLLTIFGLVQCTPDLSKTQCNYCVEYLSNIYAASYSGRIGGGARLPMCRYAYDIRRFYNLVTPPTSSPPPNPLISPPPLQDVLNVHAEWVKTSKEIACLMLESMTPELQKNMEHFGAYDMLQELKTMFSQQAGTPLDHESFSRVQARRGSICERNEWY
ncbi:cysteine-rich receptor-like protein kinase 26 [Tanacetum coccineum]